MTWLITLVVSLIYWVGFYISFFSVFKPYDDSWGGWLIDLCISSAWFITVPVKFFLDKMR